jgi:hypothetical protein
VDKGENPPSIYIREKEKLTRWVELDRELGAVPSCIQRKESDKVVGHSGQGGAVPSTYERRK